MSKTTMCVTKETLGKLREFKVHPREPDNDCLARLLRNLPSAAPTPVLRTPGSDPLSSSIETGATLPATSDSTTGGEC